MCIVKLTVEHACLCTYLRYILLKTYMVLTEMQLQLLLLSASLYILEHDTLNKVKRFVKCCLLDLTISPTLNY